MDIPTISSSFRKESTINFFDQNEHPREEDRNVTRRVIRERNVCSNAHDGYVYCLLHTRSIPNIESEVLISGSGDGDIKVKKKKNSF